MRTTVLGGGESGVGCALLAQAIGHEVLVSDAGQLSASAKTELDAANITWEEGGHSQGDLDAVDLIVKSPGIPWEAGFVAFAKTRGVQVLGEMEFCAVAAPDRMAAHRRIGITGSNGKTTTTLLTTHLLKAAGVRAIAAGNIGISYARVLLNPAVYDWVVLELSSYQLDDIVKFHCEIAMLLNLSPDHLDRYGGSFELYAQAKYNLKKTLRPGASWLIPHNYHDRFDEPPLPAGTFQFTLAESARAGTAATEAHRYDLEGTALSGPHNAANASFALSAVELALAPQAQLQGQTKAVLAKALESFKNAPHRLETVGWVDSVRYVNDSKATNLDATEKALRSYAEPIVLIAGGTDKGNDWQLLDSTLDEVTLRGVVALGVDNVKILAYFGKREVPVSDTHSLKIALVKAAELAQSGDVVLLSPACASFDLFSNYIDRGDQFRQAVRDLPGFQETLENPT